MKDLPDAGYLLEQLLHGTTDVIYFKDRNSRFVLYNSACAKKHGWSSLEEGIGKSDFNVFEKEHAKKAFADEQRVMESGKPLKIQEEKETWLDGRVTWCSSSKVPLRNDAGEIVGMFGLTRDITSHQEAVIQAREYAKQIGAIKEVLEEEARMAGQLHQSFFLSDPPDFPKGAGAEGSCIEFCYRISRCSLVSGGNCYIQRLSDTKVAIMLCDIVGSGTRSALGSALIRGILQNLSDVADNPSGYVARLNEQLYPLVHQDTLLMNTTACYMVLDVSTGELQLTCAGHPVPLLMRSGKRVRWLFENLVLRGPALAVERQAVYHTVRCRLDAGDSLVLFTDGLFTVRNSHNEPYCEKRLQLSARNLAGRPMKALLEGLEQEALSFSGSKTFPRDVCMIGIHLRRFMEAL